jgi:hypothetical protein
MSIQRFIGTASICFYASLLFLGCQKPMNQTQNHQEKVMQTTQQEWQEGSEVFFILRNQNIVPVKKAPPDCFYVKGIIEDGKFIPKGNVLGVGELAKSGRYGWLELSSKEFFPMESDKKALTPFVKGYMTDDGFMPSIREIFSEP